LGGSWFKVSPGKKLGRPPSQQKKLGVAKHTCHLSYDRKHKQEDHDSGPPKQKAKPCLKNNQSKKGWRSGSHGKPPASQAQSPEFKLPKKDINTVIVKFLLFLYAVAETSSLAFLTHTP
jgi:hypothetical protein